MKIAPFKVEQWMNAYENDAVYNLAETCVDSLTVEELLRLCGQDPAAYFRALGATRLTYSHIFGSPELLAGIQNLYEAPVPAENIVPTHGAAGANHQAIISLLAPGDSMVCLVPTYQQHYSIPESVGAEVRTLALKPENGFLPDLAELETLVTENTRLISINTPNNPTGAVLGKEQLAAIAAIAQRVGAWVLSDEVYRGITADGSYMPSIVDVYEKGISVCSMSKVFSLAGLRLGWLTTRDGEAARLFKERRDYDTISCGVLDDKLAALALAHQDAIWARGRAIVLKNRKLLDDWVQSEPRVWYVPPQGGNTALIFYDAAMKSRELCERLLRETGVFYTPGECFDLEYCWRIGYAFDSETLAEGLARTSAFLKTLPRREQ